MSIKTYEFIVLVHDAIKAHPDKISRELTYNPNKGINLHLLSTDREGIQIGISREESGVELIQLGNSIKYGIESRLKSLDDYDLKMHNPDGIIILGELGYPGRAKYGHIIFDLMTEKVSDVKMKLNGLKNLEELQDSPLREGINSFIDQAMNFNYG